MNSSWTPLPLIVALAATAWAQEPVVVEASVKKADLGDRESMPPVLPPSEAVELGKSTPEGMTAPADCVEPWFGSLEIQGKQIAVVLCKSSEDAADLDTLHIDGNADGKLEDSEKMTLTVQTMAARGGRGTRTISEAVDATLRVGETEIPIVATTYRMGDDDPGVQVLFPAYLEATVKIGDADRLVAVVDQNHDGRFDTPDDLWILASPGARPASPFALSALTEHRFEDGKLVDIQVTKDNKIEVSAKDADGPLPADMATHRARVEKMWFERFDKERDAFIEQRGVDVSRPTTAAGADWHYVSFDEAKELASKEGKPLFIDVMAFWCVWCYRMDYYTYIDQEVTQLLVDKFVPVKVIQEQAREGEYQMLMEKLGARGIPAMGVFSADGEVIHTIGGWKPPAEFVAELNAALEKAGN